MSDDDLALLEPWHVSSGFLEPLGRVVSPGVIPSLDQAQVVLQVASEQADGLLQQAREQLAADRAALLEQQAVEFADLLARQSARLEQLRQEMADSFQAQLAPVVADVLRRLGLDLPTETAVGAAVQMFIARFSHLDRPVLQLSPVDLASLERDGTLVLPSGWSVEADAMLEAGQCRLQTGQGSVGCHVARILTRLADRVASAPVQQALHEEDHDPACDESS